jgi:hypothetical protein
VTTRLSTRPALASLALIGVTLGCEGRTFSGPTQPEGPSVPRVTGIAPTAGSTEGGTLVTIIGTGFHPQARVKVNDIDMGGEVENTTTIRLTTKPHPAAQVDVVVTNPDGQADWPSGGFIFAPPQAFNFNGEWDGAAGAVQEASLRFTVENDLLTSVACGGDELTFSPAAAVKNGAFSESRDHRLIFSGRIVSASAARGTIDMPPCTSMTWVATRRQ